MTQERFDKVKEIIQRECKVENLSTHEYNLINSFLGELQRKLIEKKQYVINELYTLHKFNKLNLEIVQELSKKHSMNLIDLCKEHGITYNIE